MGIETSADLGGSESSFTSAIIAIEELARIDPSVSVMVDVHNALVNTVLRTYATKEQQSFKASTHMGVAIYWNIRGSYGGESIHIGGELTAIHARSLVRRVARLVSQVLSVVPRMDSKC